MNSWHKRDTQTQVCFISRFGSFSPWIHLFAQLFLILFVFLAYYFWAISFMFFVSYLLIMFFFQIFHNFCFLSAISWLRFFPLFLNLCFLSATYFFCSYFLIYVFSSIILNFVFYFLPFPIYAVFCQLINIFLQLFPNLCFFFVYNS